MNERQENDGTLSVASIPDDVCQRCMKPAEQQELMIVEVSYPGSYRRSKLCLDCQDDLCLAISKALSSVFCEVTPPEKRIHKTWRILAKVVQVIVISIMFLLIVGIILLFVFIPLFC